MRLFASLLILLCLLLNACTESSSQPIASPTEAVPASTAKPLPDAGLMIKRMITQDGCRDFTAEMRMTSENEKGRREQVEFRIQRKFTAEGAATFFTVLAPKEDTNKAILALEKPGQPTEAFSYLAGLRKLARMTSDRQLGYRGAKVTVQEMLGMELDQYEHTAGERVNVEGEPLIKLEFKQQPDRNLAFPRLVGYFREANQQPVRFELYNDRDELQKAMRMLEVRTIQNRQTITSVAIEDLTQKLKLRLDTSKVEYDRGLADSLFTEERLKKHITAAGQKLIP
jgi:Outer membrane lipoprotein-sorting protein